MANTPRILLYDIETTHNVVASFQLYDEYTPHTNIIQERYIVCASWKWLGETGVHAVSVLDNPKLYSKDPHNDLHVVKALYEQLSAADLIVAHNGDKFDNRYVRTRGLYHGLSPLPPIPSVDTLKIAKQQFMFNSNRLDYLGKFLGFGGKISTPPGLWLDVLKGDRKAVETMVAYNKRDVVLLEKVFLTFRPYIPNYLNRQLFGKSGCPRCGSNKTQSRGIHKAVTRTYRRYQCQSCGGWFRSMLTEGPATPARVL